MRVMHSQDGGTRSTLSTGKLDFTCRKNAVPTVLALFILLTSLSPLRSYDREGDTLRPRGSVGQISSMYIANKAYKAIFVITLGLAVLPRDASLLHYIYVFVGLGCRARSKGRIPSLYFWL
ncbi:hypothetical protein K0M31_015979 [Melipona bicolor]|uniref:Uncharacterized protein n=1 Tax=Melipona bicolor TaxID=60889 RepID=A0AA40G6J5_9HYME|nr:hypothetical protein K0M31_015979 [Melipona bicolor]